MIEVIEKSLKQLKEELIAKGVPAGEVDAFNTKAQIMTVLNTLGAKEEVKKVDSLEEKETPTEKKLVEKQWLSKAEKMRQLLMAQPQVRFLIPPDANEKSGVVEWRTDKNGNKYQYVVSGAYETVQLNGCKWIIPKGVFTNVPQQVAEVLSESYRLTSEAGKNFAIDRQDPRTGRPMNEIL